MRKPVGKRLLPPATVGALPLDSTRSIVMSVPLTGPRRSCSSSLATRSIAWIHMSIPIHSRSNRSVASSVVGQPQTGSNTTSPRSALALMIRSSSL